MNSICVVAIAVYLLVFRQCQVALVQDELKMPRACEQVVDLLTRRGIRECQSGVLQSQPAVVDAWQSVCARWWVSGILCSRLSDLRSARERLGGNVLFPGRMAVLPLD